MTFGKVELRYAIAIIFGFFIDYAVTISFFYAYKVDFKLAATYGFLVALMSNYVLLEYWVFKNFESKFSFVRLVGTISTSTVVLLLRIFIITKFNSLTVDSFVKINIVYFVASGLSMLVNYVLVRLLFVGRRKM